MSDIYALDVAAANNNDAPPNGFPEFMEYDEVNNAARELMAIIARWQVAAFSGAQTAGTQPAYTLVSGQTLGAYANGQRFAFRAHATSTGAVTLNVDGLGAVAVLDSRGNALGSGDIVLNGVYSVVKTAASWRLDGHLSAASVQALATVTLASASTTTNVGNAYSLAIANFPGAYANGQLVAFVANAANTGAATLNINGLGAEALQDPDGAALAANDLVTNQVNLAARVGGAWRVFAGLPINLATQVVGTLPIANGGTGQSTGAGAASALAQFGAGFGLQTDIASSGTTDLGTIATHNVHITGTTTITSFGSSASLNTPLYLLKFNGALTVTHNATSLLLPGLRDYVTSAGDVMLAEYVGSGNWRVREIMPRNSASMRTVAGAVLADAVFPGAICAIVENTQSSGVAGAALSIAANNVVVLSELVYNRNNAFSLSSNRVTVPAGTWEFQWSSMVTGNVNQVNHQTHLYDFTNSVTRKRGRSCFTDMGGDDGGDDFVSDGIFVLTIASPTVYEIRHDLAGGASSPTQGVAASFGGEVYGRLVIRAA